MKRLLCSVMIFALAAGTVTAYAQDEEKSGGVFRAVIAENAAESGEMDNIPTAVKHTYALENTTNSAEAISEKEKEMILTRNALMQKLYELDGKPGVTVSHIIGIPYFDSEHEDAATWAYYNEIMYGYGDNKFGNGDFATREQLAAMLFRYAGADATELDLDGIADADTISGWAEESMSWAVEKGVLEADEDSNIDPLGPATVYDLNNALKILDIK